MIQNGIDAGGQRRVAFGQPGLEMLPQLQVNTHWSISLIQTRHFTAGPMISLALLFSPLPRRHHV